MSAVVQELYTGLSIALSTEQTALSDPTVVLDAEPEASAFVLPCSNGLPAEHQRTYGLKIYSNEKLDCTSEASRPRLMALLSREPAGAGGLPEEEKTLNQSLQEGSLGRHLREGAAGVAEGMRSVAEEGLGPFSLASKEDSWSKEKEPWLIQVGSEFLSRPSCAEIAGSLGSLEENQANVQMATESLLSPMEEAQGMKADWTRLFSKAGESISQGSAGGLPESSERSAAEAATAEVSETGPLVSLQPVSVTDNAPAKAPLPEEEDDHRALTASATFSAPAGILSSPEAGRETFFGQDADVKATLASCLPSQQNQTNVPSHRQSVSVLDSKETLAALPSDASSEASDNLFEGRLECGNALGEETMDIFEAVCETEEECPPGGERSLRSLAGCEEIELLEEWASPPKVEEALSPPRSSEELPRDSDEEQQAGDCLDHSYSCVWERTAEVEEEEDAVQRCEKETQERPPAEAVKQELQNSQFAKEKSTHLETGTPFRLGVAHPSSEGCSEDDLGPETDNVQKDEPQQRMLPSTGSLAPAAEESKSLLGGANCLGCFRNSCSTSSGPLATYHGCDAKLCGGPLLQMDSNSNQRKEMGTSAAPLHAASSSRVEETSQAIQPSDVHSFSQQPDAVVSSCRFFDPLPKEEVPRTRAQLERQDAACLLHNSREESSSAVRSCGHCTKASEGAWSSTASLLGDAEESTADSEAVVSKACGHAGGCVSGLCAAVKTCGTTLGSVSLDDGVLQVRTENDGLEMCHASMLARTVGPLQEGGDREALDCPAYGTRLQDLGGTQSTLGSVCSVDMPGTGLMKADVLEPREDVESQKSDGDGCINAGEILDADLTHVYPPDTDPEQKLTKASLVTGPGDVESNEVKLRGDRDLEKTIHPPELGEFLKDQGKEELQRPQVHSSSPLLASEMSSSKTDLNSDPLGLAQQQGWPLRIKDIWTKDQGQLQEAASQMKIQAFACRNYCNRLVSFNQKSETLETEGLERQQCLLIISCKQNKDCTGQAGTHPAEKAQKPVSCHQSERLCPKGDPPPAPGLWTGNEATKTGPQNALGDCSSSKMESESLRDPSGGVCVEPGDSKPPSECLEPAPKRRKVNGLVQEEADATQTSEFSSASQSTSRSPSDALDENHFLTLNCESASPPTQTCFHPDSVTLATADGQKSTEGARSGLCQNREMESSVLRPAQDPAACLSERGEPPTSPTLNALCSHPAKERSSATVPLEREGDDHTNLFPAENEKVSCPFKEAASVGSSLASKVKPSCVGDRKAGAEVTGATVSSASYRVDPAETSLRGCQREAVRAAGKVKLAVQALPSTRDSPGPLLQDLKLLVGKQDVSVPLKAETQATFSFVHPSEDSSGLSPSKDRPCVKEPSKPGAVRWHAEDTGRALQSEDLLSPRSPGTLCRAVPCAAQGGTMSEAAPRGFGSRGRNWQSAGGSQEPAGGQQVPGGHLVNKGIEVPAKNTGGASAGGGCPALVQTPADEVAEECLGHPVVVCGGAAGREKGKAGSLLKQRLLRTGQPSESSLRGKALNPQMPAPQTSAVRCAVEGSKTELLCSSLRGKSCQDLTGLKYTGPSIPSRSFQSCSRPGASRNIPAVPASFTLPHDVAFGCSGIRGASGSARKVRRPLLFQGQPGKACRKVPWPGGGFKAARKSNPTGHSTSLKDPLEIVPTHRRAPPGSVCFAVQAGAVEDTRGVLWDQTPKPRASQSSLLDPFRLSAQTKGQAVLRRLSALAHQLVPPARNQQRLKPPRPAQHLRLSEARSWLGSRKLLQVFSCINVKLSSRWMNGSRHCPKTSGSPPLALYPVEPMCVCFLELSDKTPLSPRAPLLPASFHMTMSAAVPLRDLLGATAPQGVVPSRAALGGAHGAVRPSEWIFSFLLPQSCRGTASVQEGAWMPAESSLAPASLSAAMDGERDALAQRRAGWPVLGLQTVLALSSPGCYRVWTKKRSLQKLAVLQFTRGLKGLKCSASVSADLFSSLPCSLGRGLSIWSQHGLSTCSSEFTPLHSSHCKRQPLATVSTSLGLRNSSATLPHVPRQAIEAPRAVNDEMRLGPSLSALLPTSCTLLEPALSPLGFLAPEYQAHEYLDELDVSLPVLPKTRTRLDKAESEKRPKKVSQIRIRKTIPKPDPNLTPMGLPRPKRLKKTEFSLEEIYTNKNYKSPPTTRCLETIFEEPRERNGSLISVSQQKRKRILEFQDFTIPRKRKARARVKVMGSSTRAQKAALEGRELDVLLLQKLTDLEAFFAEEEEREQASGS